MQLQSAYLRLRTQYPRYGILYTVDEHGLEITQQRFRLLERQSWEKANLAVLRRSQDLGYEVICEEE